MRFLRFSPDKEDHSSPTRESTHEKPALQESDDALALAHAIHGAGMSGVASFALGVLKPLHWLGGQALWVLQPFIEALGVGSGHGSRAGIRAISTGGMARLLERDGGLDELAAHLDRLQSGSEYEKEDGIGK